jgi:hypothetical protein
VTEDERTFNREVHFGFAVPGSGRDTARLWDLMTGPARLVPDGGGHNPHENAAAGHTVLCFQGPGRLELLIDDHHPGLLHHHQQVITNSGSTPGTGHGRMAPGIQK